MNHFQNLCYPSAALLSKAESLFSHTWPLPRLPVANVMAPMIQNAPPPTLPGGPFIIFFFFCLGLPIVSRSAHSIGTGLLTPKDGTELLEVRELAGESWNLARVSTPWTSLFPQHCASNRMVSKETPGVRQVWNKAQLHHLLVAGERMSG